MDDPLIILLGLFVIVPLLIWRITKSLAASNEGVAQSETALQAKDLQKVLDRRDNWSGTKAANEEVREQLRLHNDDLAIERLVDHFAVPLPQSATSAQDLGQLLRADGYEVGEYHPPEGLLQFSKPMSPGSKAFDRMTTELSDFLHEHGWQYDGWGCPVTTEKDAQQ